MNEQTDDRTTEPDGWPTPSSDVLRDLERRGPLWVESDPLVERAA
jgi:hypothetical protein